METLRQGIVARPLNFVYLRVDGNQNNETGKPATDDVAANEPNIMPADIPLPAPLENQLPASEITPPQAQPPMEVHHHGHVHENKKWKEYLFQFLMLFLAVFCGFLAEYQLEHTIEKERAKDLAENLYHEVYADSIVMQQAIANRLIKEKSYLDFAVYVKDSSLINPSLNFYRAFAIAFVNHQALVFEPKDGILNQLINSGSLRYFRSSQLQTDIGLLSGVIAKIRARNTRETSFLDFTLRPFQMKHFDNRWIRQLTENGRMIVADAIDQKDLRRLSSPRILHIDQFDRDEAENIASQGAIMSSGTRLIFFKEYIDANHDLLETLRREYHLK